MIITEYEHWLVVRQSRRRRIYRVTLVATVSRTLRTPLGARRTRQVVSCNYYGGFISGACVSSRGVYTARVARSGAARGEHPGTFVSPVIPVRRLPMMSLSMEGL